MVRGGRPFGTVRLVDLRCRSFDVPGRERLCLCCSVRRAAAGLRSAPPASARARCSPPAPRCRSGSAAIVGDQRITVSSLDTQVSNWQTAAKPYGSSLQVTSANAPSAVLSWLIRFAVMDQVAASNGISVTQAQAQAGLSSLTQVAQQNGLHERVAAADRERGAPAAVPGGRPVGRAAGGLRAEGERRQGADVHRRAERHQHRDHQGAVHRLRSRSTSRSARSSGGSTTRRSRSCPRRTRCSAPDPATSPSPASTEGLTPAC